MKNNSGIKMLYMQWTTDHKKSNTARIFHEMTFTCLKMTARSQDIINQKNIFSLNQFRVYHFDILIDLLRAAQVKRLMELVTVIAAYQARWCVSYLFWGIHRSHNAFNQSMNRSFPIFLYFRRRNSNKSTMPNKLMA